MRSWAGSFKPRPQFFSADLSSLTNIFEYLEPMGFTPLLSFALQKAAKLGAETMISRGLNSLRAHFDILAKMHQKGGSEEPVLSWVKPLRILLII